MTPLQNRRKTIKWFRCSHTYLKSIEPQNSLPILDITKQHIQGTKYRNWLWHFKVLIDEKCILKVAIKPKICQKCSKLHYYFIIQPGLRFWIISQIILQVIAIYLYIYIYIYLVIYIYIYIYIYTYPSHIVTMTQWVGGFSAY